MEVMFFVILPKEFVNTSITMQSKDDQNETVSMESVKEISEADEVAAKRDAFVRTASQEFVVLEKNPFATWRTEENGSEVRVLNVVDMVLNALDGLMPGYVCLPGEKNMTQISFMTRGAKSMAIFSKLNQLGVGKSFGSISVVPVSVSASTITTTHVTAANSKPSVSNDETGPSLKLRQLIENLRADSRLTFDIIILTVLASILAAVGLATNNVVMVVASMLVSPLMGPILGLSFGTVIYDWSLVFNSLVSELLLLLCCVMVGFACGMPFAVYEQQLDWPTFEMSSRGEPISLLYGLCVAIPSGVGVAMSILQSNATSLVGVAISASLLPPAVNSGLLFASLVFGNHMDKADHYDVLYLALFSFALTALNIICIYFASIIWFKIKEVAPYETSSDVWKCYVEEVVRHRTLKGNDAKKMKHLLHKLLANDKHLDHTETTKMNFNENSTMQEYTSPRQVFSNAAISEIFKPPKDIIVPEQTGTVQLLIPEDEAECCN